MIYLNTLAAGIMPAILLLAIASTVGSMGAAFASTGNTTEGTTAGDTATTIGGGNRLAGIIASLQLAPDRLAPEWVTAGYWELESDMPLFGGTTATEPTVNSFDAVV